MATSQRHTSFVSQVAATIAESSTWITGRVTEYLGDGWVEVEMPADNPVSTGTGPTDGTITQVGALVRVMRDSSGRIEQVSSPLSLSTEDGAADVQFTGPVGNSLKKAMDDAAQALAGLTKAAQDAAAAQSAANSAAQSATDALKAAENAGAPAVFATDAPTDPADGQTWYTLNSDGQVTGVNEWVAASSSWVPRPILAGEVIVPGSVGSTLIADGAVTTPKVNTDDLWATFVKSKGVTTDMLVTGSAKITSDLIADTISGKTLTGATVIGPTIKTNTNANTGIVLDTSGIRLYNSASHQQTGIISADTGQIKVANSDGNLISLSDMVFGMEVFQSTEDVDVVKPTSSGAATGPWASVNMFTWNAVSKQVYVIVSALDRMIFSGGRQKNPPVMANMTIVDNSNGWTKDIGTTVGGGSTTIPASSQDSVTTHPVLMGQYGNLTIGKSYTIRIGFRSFNNGWDRDYYGTLSSAKINPITAFKFIG